MASGWAGDGAVNEQIESTVNDAMERVRNQLPKGDSAAFCDECDAPIPEARRKAVPGVRHCVTCQAELDQQAASHSLYNRRGSKDSQLR